jgi:hypothetical protein
MTDPVKAIARRIGRRCAPLAATEVRDGRSTQWRSLLFDGARHRIELGLSGDRAEEALDVLEEVIGDADFFIAGHLVAELRVASVSRSGGDLLVTLDALTIEADPGGR